MGTELYCDTSQQFAATQPVNKMHVIFVTSVKYINIQRCEEREKMKILTGDNDVLCDV
jgi:hypothetical protein